MDRIGYWELSLLGKLLGSRWVSNSPMSNDSIGASPVARDMNLIKC